MVNSNQKISLNFHLNGLLFNTSFIPPTLYFVMLLIYLIEKRFAGYFPTISETGTEYPNTIIIFLVFSTVSGFMFYEMISICICLWNTYHPKQFLKILILMSAILSCLALDFIGVFPCNTIPKYHFLSTFISFSNIVFLEIWGTIISRKCKSKILLVTRCMSIIFQILCLIIVAISETKIKIRINVTTAALGEWLTFFFLPFWTLSMNSELREYNQILIFD